MSTTTFEEQFNQRVGDFITLWNGAVAQPEAPFKGNLSFSTLLGDFWGFLISEDPSFEQNFSMLECFVLDALSCSDNFDDPTVFDIPLAIKGPGATTFPLTAVDYKEDEEHPENDVIVVHTHALFYQVATSAKRYFFLV